MIIQLSLANWIRGNANCIAKEKPRFPLWPFRRLRKSDTSCSNHGPTPLRLPSTDVRFKIRPYLPRIAQHLIDRFKVLLATWLLLPDCCPRIPVWSRNPDLRVKQPVVLISRQVLVGRTVVLKPTYQQRNRLLSESLSVPPRCLLPSLVTVFASAISGFF